MKQRRRKFFWGIIITLFAAVAGIVWTVGHSVLGCTVASKEQIRKLCESPEKNVQNMKLSWNDIELPYDSRSGRYILPQEAEGNWQGTLRAESEGKAYRLTVSEEKEQCKKLMETGEPLEIYASRREGWTRLEVQLTGLPVLSIKTTVPAQELEDNAEGWMVLAEPDGAVTTSRAVYHVRGFSSRKEPKKNYSIHLKNDENGPKKENLLGLREDDDWKLYGMALDPTLCREKIANELWNEMAELDGSPNTNTMEYVQLIIDNEYKGLYMLAPRLDEKSYDLNDDSILYKFSRIVDMWVPYAINTREGMKTNTWDDRIEIIWPKEYHEGVWGALNDYAQQFLWDNGNSAVWEQAEIQTDKTNMVDTALFKQVTLAADNLFYNTYYLQYGPGQPMYRIPYDIDRVFGVGLAPELTVRDYVEEIVNDNELEAFYRLQPEFTQQLIRERWAALRCNVFSDEHVEELWRETFRTVKETGGLALNRARWNSSVEAQGQGTGTEPAEQELEALLQAQKARMAYLDTYMQEYVPPERAG